MAMSIWDFTILKADAPPIDAYYVWFDENKYKDSCEYGKPFYFDIDNTIKMSCATYKSAN